MLAELAVIVIILLTIAFVFLKGTIIKAFLLLINTLIAAIVAFSYFEFLGRLIIGYNMVPQFASAAALLLIFAFTLAILNTITDKLMTADIYFGDMLDKVIRSFIAVLTGFAIAGVILTVAAMLPIGTKWPYERYSATPGQSTEPQKKLILNADGFITSFVSQLSQGSMSGQKSFAVFHPNFLNEIYLNRVGSSKTNTLAEEGASISVESALAPQTPMVSASNQPLNQSPQTKAVILKTRIDAKKGWTMAQIRLVCKTSDSAGNLMGSGRVFWPVGIARGNAVDMKSLTEELVIKQVDLVFFIPTDAVPVMIQLKQNAVAPVGKVVTGSTASQPQQPAAAAQRTPAQQPATTQRTPAQQTPARQAPSTQPQTPARQGPAQQQAPAKQTPAEEE